MFYGITDLTTFILGTIFIVLLPGPNSLYVMAAASRWGVRAGYQGAAGIFVGDTILMLLAVTGMASVLRATPRAVHGDQVRRRGLPGLGGHQPAARRARHLAARGRDRRAGGRWPAGLPASAQRAAPFARRSSSA